MEAERKDTWTAGKLYEPYVGRWSRLVARDFLAWLEGRSDADWLDVGCGTGALTETILQQARPRTVKGVDQSAGFVEYATAQIAAVVSGLMLNFVPEPARAPSVKCREQQGRRA